MGIRITCPECGKSGVAPDNAVGRKARCRNCQTEFRIEAGPPQEPPLRIVAETNPDETLPDMSDLSLRVRAQQFLECPPPLDLGDHSLGHGLIRAYAAGDEEKVNSPEYLKVLATFMVVLRLGSGGSRACKEYIAEEVQLLKEIKEDLQN